MYYVYILRNEKGETYTGYTSDLRKRLKSHKDGRNESTRGHQWELIYYEAYKAEQDARNRETKLKESSQAKRFLKERIKQSLEVSE